MDDRIIVIRIGDKRFPVPSYLAKEIRDQIDISLNSDRIIDSFMENSVNAIKELKKAAVENKQYA